jgi:AbrB family looped-hinge helix DNA binding protein
MSKEEMNVGSKGQIVIPVALRKALEITPGSKVIFRLDGDRIILEKLKINSVNIFRDIAKNGRSINKIAYNQYKNEVFRRNKS